MHQALAPSNQLSLPVMSKSGAPGYWDMFESDLVEFLETRDSQVVAEEADQF